MPKYQIRFCDSKGHGSFQYVDCDAKDAPEKAAEKANEYITRQNELRRGFTIIQNKKTVHVWEIDMETKQPKKKGHRFKLTLNYVQATYSDGTKERKEWYEPMEITQKTK